MERGRLGEIGRGELWRRRGAGETRRGIRRGLGPRRCKLAVHGQLRALLARKLSSNWSPQQIAGWLRRRYPGQGSLQVSHETIYRSLFVQARGVLKRELLR